MNIAIIRRHGGLGDQICCEAVVRFVRKVHPEAHIVWVTGENYLPLFYDMQEDHADQIIAPDVADEASYWSLIPWDTIYMLDGPEQKYAIERNYDLQESRIETWFRYVRERSGLDIQPTLEDFIPRWSPTSDDIAQTLTLLRRVGLQPFEYTFIQWGSAIQGKNYPHMRELIECMRAENIPLLVAHSSNVPDMNIPVAIDIPLRTYGTLLMLANSSIGPDSAVSHFSAAVETPYLGLFGPTSGKVYLKHYPHAMHIARTETSGQRCEHTYPCWLTKTRNWWCQSNTNKAPWCLSHLDPTEVIRALSILKSDAVSHNKSKRERLVKSLDSNIVCMLDPRVDPKQLTDAFSARPEGGTLRWPKSIDRDLVS